ncbi:hypothetical protein Hanom_Chr15g01378971 [Helianthus anomalus]
MYFFKQTCLNTFDPYFQVDRINYQNLQVLVKNQADIARLSPIFGHLGLDLTAYSVNLRLIEGQSGFLQPWFYL